MVKYADSMLKLQELLEKEAVEGWSAGPIHISIATSLTDDTPIQLNLSDTIGHGRKKPRTPSDLNCYWLPAHLNKNTETFRHEQIHPIFVQACYKAGFNLHGKWVQNDDCIQFSCAQSKFHNEEKNREHNAKKPRKVKNVLKGPAERDRKTSRSVKDIEGQVTCTFSFRVHWDKTKERWFVPHQQSGSLSHQGHSHFDPNFLRIQTKHGLSQEEQDLASDCFQTQMSTTAATNLANLRNNIGLEWHQLQYLKNRKKNDLVIQGMDPNDDAASSHVVSAADRVLALLKSKPNVSFTALTAEMNSGLITLKKRKKGFDNSITVEEFTRNIHDGYDGPSEYAGRQFGINDDLLKAVSSAKSSNKREVPQNLHLKNGQILLALAWTTDEGRRKFDAFPEFVSGDATEQTNSEERPFYTLMGKDNMNKSFAHTWAFMPSNATWIYSWLFEEAVPTLHPGTAMERVQLIVTDACNQEFSAISNVIGKGKDMSKMYPMAWHRWCGWHRVNRNFTNSAEYKSLLAKVRNSSVNNSIEISLVTRFMWYCIKHYETKEELELAFKLMNQYLGEDQVSHKGEIEEGTREKIRDFFTKHFENKKHMLCEAAFEEVMTFGNCTTGVSEAENRAYKKSAGGVTPSDDLAASADKILSMDKAKTDKKARKVVHSLKSQSGKAKDREKNAKGLSDYINKKLGEEFRQGVNHLAYRKGENLFYVKRDYSKFDDVCSPDDMAAVQSEAEELFSSLSESIDSEKTRAGTTSKKRKKTILFGGGKDSMDEFKALLCKQIQYVVPKFERTAIVTVEDIPGSDCNEKMLVCGRCFKKTGHACKHVYRLINRNPKLTDAHIRWHLSYAHYYGRNGDMSKHFQDLRDKVDQRGIPITEEELISLNAAFPIDSGDREEEYFSRSLPKMLRLRGSSKNNHWKATQYRFDGVNPSCFACDDNVDESNDVNLSRDSSTADTCIAGDSASISVIPSKPFGASAVIQGKSSYMVPSQMDNDSDEDCTQGGSNSAYLGFMPRYETLSKLADGTGDRGKAILKKHFGAAEIELLAEARKQEGVPPPTECSGMQSQPKTSRKRVPIRIGKSSSP